MALKLRDQGAIVRRGVSDRATDPDRTLFQFLDPCGNIGSGFDELSSQGQRLFGNRLRNS